MTEFLKQCAEKDTLTAEDRARLIEVADKLQVACEYCDYLQDEVCVNNCGAKMDKERDHNGNRKKDYKRNERTTT